LKNHTNAERYVYYVEAVLDWLVNAPFYFLSVLLDIFYTANISHFTNLEHCFGYFLFYALMLASHYP